MTLNSRNLNTIPVLHALLQESSVGGAARRLGLSQPTVSGILARLRTEFGDPLLVRAGRVMRPTARALQLRPTVAALYASLEELYKPEKFSPAALRQLFIIAAPDHLAFLFTPGLLDHVANEAPGVRLRFVNVPSDLDAYMADDMVDLAVCGNFDLWPSLRYRSLFTERIVAAVWTEHPLARRERIAMEDILSYPSSTMDSGLSRTRQKSATTGVPSLDADTQITLSQFTDAVLLTVGTDFVAPAPEALVDRLAEILPIKKVSLTETDVVDAGMFWSPMRDHDPAQAWFRAIVERSARDLGWSNRDAAT